MSTVPDDHDDRDPSFTDAELGIQATASHDWDAADDAITKLKGRLDRFVEVLGLVEVLGRIRATELLE